MPLRKSRPSITYANTLSQKQSVKPKKDMKPSPPSARPAFDTVRHGETKKREAKHAAQSLSLNAEPKLQPRGMGERGVNWKAHLNRLRKAKRAVRQNTIKYSHSTHKEFNKNKIAPNRNR